MKNKVHRFVIIRSICLFSLLILAGCDSEKRGVLDQKTQQAMSPEQVLQSLIAGNERFRESEPLNRGSLQELGMQASEMGQFPKAVILSCMDSRSIPEIVFDQSVADIFTLRVAGNVVNKDILASMEFATKYSGSKLIVIMGHTQCGAIVSACRGIEDGNLKYLLNEIQPAVKDILHTSDHEGACDNTEIITNITLQNVENMMQQVLEGSQIIKEMISRGEIAMVGALHDLYSGTVSFKFAQGLDL